METALPSQINYGGQSMVPPDTESYETCVRPTNNGSFTQGSQAYFDIPCVDFLDPNSMYIRYRLNTTSAGAVTQFLRGAPVYSLIQRVQTYMSGQSREIIDEYGQVMTYLLNNQFDVAQKAGMASYGYSIQSASETNIYDGLVISHAGAGTLSTSLSAPFVNCLSMVDGGKFIPLEGMNSLRYVLTFDSIANAFCATGATNPAGGTFTAPTAYTIDNLELVFTAVRFNNEIKNMLLGAGDELVIKTQSLNNITSILPASSSGVVAIPFQHRLSSIKSLHTLFVKNDATTNPNGKYESRDVTSANGSLQMECAGKLYPQLALDTLNNRSAVLMEGKKAWNALYSTDWCPSINIGEFGAIDNTTSSVTLPAKFYFSVNTERVSSNQYLLSGLSSANSPIVLRLNIGTTTSAHNYNISCIALYDMLIRVNTATRQVDVSV
jgi:hypothetical protein